MERLSLVHNIPSFYYFTNSMSIRSLSFDLDSHYTKQEYLFIKNIKINYFLRMIRIYRISSTSNSSREANFP